MNKLFICQTFHWDLGLLSRPKYIYVWQVVLSSTTCTWIKNTIFNIHLHLQDTKQCLDRPLRFGNTSAQRREGLILWAGLTVLLADPIYLFPFSLGIRDIDIIMYIPDGFWLPIWYFQTILTGENHADKTVTLGHGCFDYMLSSTCIT
jgi:hypothetical protein